VLYNYIIRSVHYDTFVTI